MITNKQLKTRIIPKIQRVRATGKEVFVKWLGGEHTIQVASDIDGILINAGKVRISINANFIRNEIGEHATLNMVERCFYVRTNQQTIADYE